MSTYYNPRPAWRDHVCGLYYNVTYHGYLQKTYLPQVDLQAHATILATTSRTVLTQTFVNPSTAKGIREVRYAFPLYDGVSVVGFTCHVGDRTIIGEVKEKEKARAVFQEAVARGETAGLLEQLPDAADVFTTTVGNIPPGAKVIIKITYLGELKHDMEVDGIRFTIPNIICPRYGQYPGNLRSTSATDAVGGSISITVDAEMAEGSLIQKVQSPTHPISMTMGTTSFAPNAEPTMTKASATLTLGEAALDSDFILQVIAKNTGVPKAVLETHPTIPNHRAVMATLVPKFSLPAEKPEVVFVCDRSGSMAGSNMTLVIQALKVFLKSLPVGVKFNICSFGSRHSFLWKKSVTYSQKTLNEAIRHADQFSANYGGTEMLEPLKATIQQRYKDMPLEVMMLTDGEIWNQQALFTYLNQSVIESKEPIRIFTLGIGNGVSHSLVEGVAKAGNGFSQTVGTGEKMDSKVVRMLKGALSPHVNDYTLEVKYSDSTKPEEDDFEIVEKVTDSLKVKLDLGEKDKEAVGFQSQAMRAFFTDYYQKKPISLFDTSADPDKEDPPAYDETGEARYAHLPKIPAPKLLQAPQNIPSLFAFNRTTAYLLLGPEAPRATPRSVVLRGSSKHGPLELEIPIQVLDMPGETIHQLAAKKAISELEQGRGWLSEAKDETGALIKSKFEGRFEDMVEREAVRLGVQFQVGGKWCSFVAVESNKKGKEKEKEGDEWEWLEDEAPEQITPSNYNYSESSEDLFGSEDEDDEMICERLKTTVNKLSEMAKQIGSEIEEQNGALNRLSFKSANIVDSTDPFQAQSQQHLPQQLYQQQLAQMQNMSTSTSSARARTRKVKCMAPNYSAGSATSEVMNNLASVAERGERLDSLSAKSDALSMQSKAFYGNAKKSGGLFGGLFGSSKPSPPVGASMAGSTNSGGGMFGKLGGSLFGSNSGGAPTASAAYSMPAGAMVAPSAPPGAAVPPQANHALQDYQMQCMLLEQQNKKRLLMARQEPAAAPTQQLQAQQAAPAFGAAFPPPPSPPPAAMPSMPAPQSASPFGAAPLAPTTTASIPFGSAPDQGVSMNFGDSSGALENFDFDSFLHAGDQMDMDFNLENELEDTIDEEWAPKAAPAAPALKSKKKRQASSPAPKPRAQPQAKLTPEDLLHHLISLQTFEGSWEWSTSLLAAIKSASFTLNKALIDSEIATGVQRKHLATALVVALLEEKLAAFQDSWELVVDKAKEWLEGETGDAEKVVERVKKIVV